MKLCKRRLNLLNLLILFFFALTFFAPILGPAQDKTYKSIRKSVILGLKSSVSENVVYKKDRKGGNLLLDIYRPKKNPGKKIPVLIFVHGGSWISGDKTIPADTFTYIEHFLTKMVERQYAVISINYTLLNKETHFPLPAEDTKDAVRWVRKNAERYNFDPENIGLFGVSAGAHLALLAAYTSDREFLGDASLIGYSSKVNYAISNYGPTDLNALCQSDAGKFKVFIVGLFDKKLIALRHRLIELLSGYDIDHEQDKIIAKLSAISPVQYAAHAVPTLLIHGNKDQAVPLKQSVSLHEKLDKFSIENKLVTVDRANHLFIGASKDALDRLVDDMIRFATSKRTLKQQ